MARGLLDTNILIDSAALVAVSGDIDKYVSSTIVRSELVYGLQTREPGSAARSNRQKLIELLDSLNGFWLPFDLNASQAYGALTARPNSAMREKDTLIAAQALSLDLPVVTNDHGFSRFEGVVMHRIQAAPPA
ncbi:type II toxin-antitoxin system VapC family toxin [Leucobacter insecticola]|uniref:Type II toxin-antitoxin system VapC family toxin n=1 Tax=Leucobacter insecticola TaxID=2714934 RepID=A0A6G8FHD1_9MICO|nr:type II toxin-antitoxin system VapC family toxin [Leucobacter insecticola]QIM15764.1 type II toxin-antitoxin system VapC family toxin [Leucobacter insecticola]